MSSKTLDRKFEAITREYNIQVPINLKNFIIPFSEFGQSIEYIYFGYEKIPFIERHPIYQRIIKNEFDKSIKEFQDTMKK
ncbi:MAG: hypothetical protein ACFFC3_15160 [Candidatus Odinarchaeota archaeon]